MQIKHLLLISHEQFFVMHIILYFLKRKYKLEH